MTLVYQETQFVSSPLMDFEPVKTSIGCSNMIVFPEITDGSTVPCFEYIGVYLIGTEQILPGDNYSSPSVIVPGPGL